MRNVLLVLTLIMGPTTCHNQNNDTADDTGSSPHFMMGDSNTRFGRGGSGSGPASWTFPPTAARSRIVETKYGRVQGLSVTLFSNIHYTRNFPLKNKIVEIFYAIPYAAAPVKSHRFSPTQTPVPWNDVRATIQPSPVCPQIFPDIRNESAALKEMPKGYLEYLRRVEPYLRNQSEDCLYLNVFSPIGPNNSKLKPVLVFIHGGNFAWGSGSLVDGTAMSAYSDAVFVSINFRLNILGFLNLNDSPGSKPRVANYGLMDIIAALHWVKENILKFNGDPENISLIGYESGAACINFLMSSPTVAPGLFARAILISGSSHAPWSLVSEPWLSGLSVAQALNCSSGPLSPGNGTLQEHQTTTTTPSPGTSTSTHHSPFDPVIECLKTKNFTEFTKFSLPKFSVDFGPSIDGIVIKSNFRGSQQSQMGKRDVGKKYDILVGLSSLERLTEFSETDLEFGFESARRDAILRTLVRNSYRYHRNEIFATITNEYIDWERTAQHPISTRDMTVNAVTDCLSLAPLVSLMDSNLVKKSFFYVFEHSTKDGLYNYHRAGSGAGGGEELNYIFGYPLIEAASGSGQLQLPFIPSPLPSNYSKQEIALSELWMSFISNFVHSGSPNGPIKIDSISSWPVSKERNRYKNTAGWEPWDRLHQKYLEIGANKIRTRSHYRAHQISGIWLRLVPELQRSGAQMASSYHNRMKGGNDPVLYAGKLKQPEDEPSEEGEEHILNSGLNSALLYDLLLGYGIPDGSRLPSAEDGDDSQPNNAVKGKGHNTLTMTTCYSPVSSSVQSQGGNRANGNNETESKNFFDSNNFPQYSVILAVTIAVGCSLLILNILIFAIVYCQRDRNRRAKLLKSSKSSLSGANTNISGCDTDEETQSNSNKLLSSPSYVVTVGGTSGEPPELLKSSNSSRSNAFLQNPHQVQLRAEIEALEVLELTVKQHQQELMGEKALLTRDAVQEHTNYSSTLPRQYYQTQATSSTSSQNSQSHQPQGILVHGKSLSTTPLAVSTLPRCNGTLGGFGLAVKPNPPPRVDAGLVVTSGTLRRGTKLEFTENSDSNNEIDEMKV